MRGKQEDRVGHIRSLPVVATASCYERSGRHTEVRGASCTWEGSAGETSCWGAARAACEVQWLLLGQRGSMQLRWRGQHTLHGLDSCHCRQVEGSAQSECEVLGGLWPQRFQKQDERRKGTRCCVWPHRWRCHPRARAGGLHLRKDTWSRLSTEDAGSFCPVVSEALS